MPVAEGKNRVVDEPDGPSLFTPEQPASSKFEKGTHDAERDLRVVPAVRSAPLFPQRDHNSEVDLLIYRTAKPFQLSRFSGLYSATYRVIHPSHAQA